jgi:hypothetical protein
MKIRAGYRIAYDCAQPTPMILTLSVHPSRRSDLITPDRLTVHPFVPVTEYCDGFGNVCQVLRAPQGRLTLSSDFVIADSGEADDSAPLASQIPLDTLPVDTLVYLLGSRYCETDRLSELAWSKFGKMRKGGWFRPSATSSTNMCDSVMSMRMSARPRSTPMWRAVACAVTSPISPSRYAAA